MSRPWLAFRDSHLTGVAAIGSAIPAGEAPGATSTHGNWLPPSGMGEGRWIVANPAGNPAAAQLLRRLEGVRLCTFQAIWGVFPRVTQILMRAPQEGAIETVIRSSGELDAEDKRKCERLVREILDIAFAPAPRPCRLTFATQLLPSGYLEVMSHQVLNGVQGGCGSVAPRPWRACGRLLPAGRLALAKPGWRRAHFRDPGNGTSGRYVAGLAYRRTAALCSPWSCRTGSSGRRIRGRSVVAPAVDWGARRREGACREHGDHASMRRLDDIQRISERTFE